MSTTAVPKSFTVAIDESEWRLVRSLRDIPPSPLRDRMVGLMGEVIAFVASPGCPEMQADGVPCNDVHMSCDCCRKTIRLLDSLRSRLWNG